MFFYISVNFKILDKILPPSISVARPAGIDITLPYYGRQTEMSEAKCEFYSNLVANLRCKKAKQNHGFTSVCGGIGVGKSRFCWELGQTLQQEMKTKCATDLTGNQYSFKDFFSFMYISTEFASSKGGVRTEEMNLQLSMQVCFFIFN